MLASPHEVIYQSVTELAEGAEVSEASVIRLCRDLGFKGVQDLKLALAADVAISPETPPSAEPLQRVTEAALGAAGLLYEDRPAGELVKAQLRAAGCYGVETPGEAAFVLAVNTPGRTQREPAPDTDSVETADRHLPEFVDFIGRMLGAGKRVSVADIAYSNGAEARFFRMLQPLPSSPVSAPGTRRATRSGAPSPWASRRPAYGTAPAGPSRALIGSSTAPSIRAGFAPS